MTKSKDKELDFESSSTALAIPGQQATVELPATINIDEEDFIQQEEEALLYPYISIRQKDHRDGNKAAISWTKGWWKLKVAGKEIDDIEKIRATVLFWSKVRTYFPDGAERPYCKSIDNIIGALKTDETSNGICAACQYSQFVDGKKPKCSEGRNIYAIVENVGPAVIRLTPGSIAAWRAFDNLMRAKRVRHNGRVDRLPWFFSIIEFGTEKKDRPGMDIYWAVNPTWIAFNEDPKIIEFLRTELKQKESYDKTAAVVDLESEDVNGKPSNSDDVDEDLEF